MKKKNTVLDIDGVARELFEEEGSGSGSGLLDSIWNTAKPYWDKTTDIASSFFSTTPTDGTFWSKQSTGQLKGVEQQNPSDGINQAKDFAKESVKYIVGSDPDNTVGDVIKLTTTTGEKPSEEVKPEGDIGGVIHHVEKQIEQMPMWQKGALGGAALGIPLTLIAVHMYNKNKEKKNQQVGYYQNQQYPYNY